MYHMQHINTQNLVVSVEQVKPNSWNPKINYQDNPENKIQYERIRKSVSRHGQIDPILVRETDDGYEIVNGYHRYCVAKDLGWTELEIKNLGRITDAKAKAIALATEDAAIPLDKLMTAQIVREVLALGMENLEDLPYSEEEAEALKKLVEFDFSDLNAPDGLDEKPEKYVIVIPEEHIERWTQAKERNNCDTDIDLVLALLDADEYEQPNKL